MLVLLLSLVDPRKSLVAAMTASRRLHFKRRAQDMFAHGYSNYLNRAYPLDELDPLRCMGRGPDTADPNNWNINDVLGNFSMTLVDSLDAIYTVLGKAEFERAVNLVVRDASFDQNSRVQVFEVTIRMLGGLVSAHLLASGEAGVSDAVIAEYKGELLSLAHDLGRRLLPAFDTPTGMPFPRINLRHGVLDSEVHDTCTAGAGTLLLEFGTLSRLVNDPIFLNVAKRSFEYVWSKRSSLDLLGNTLDIDTGVWIHKLSGIGAGADSFYEYALKAHVLFGNPEYYEIFQKSYAAIQLYNRDTSPRKNKLYKNVDMDTGNQFTNWVDSLSAFWPGLQVLAGDLENAVFAHFAFFSIWQKYGAFPERFDFVGKVANIGHYPIRPELIESTYFLYLATKNPYYLEVGAVILEDLDRQTRTSCGFGSMQSVGSLNLEGRMESFVLSETLKYLYLLFDEENIFNTQQEKFIYTTEGHVLPIPRSHLHHKQHRKPLSQSSTKSCPAYTPHLQTTTYTPFASQQLHLPVPLPDLAAINTQIGNPIHTSLDLLARADDYDATTCAARIFSNGVSTAATTAVAAAAGLVFENEVMYVQQILDFLAERDAVWAVEVVE
ncbi:hypothetical protein HK100_007627, partial [Physocladia obscura]